MCYLISAEHTTQVSYPETVPSALKKYILPGSNVFSGEGYFGYFLFQQLQGLEPETSLWYSNYLLEQEEIFRIQSNEPHLRLQFALSNNFYYRLENGEEQVLQQGCFNLFYDPSIDGTMSMHPGRMYSMLSVYFPYASLKKWEPYFPPVARFFEKVFNKQPAALCDCNQVTTAQMDDVIQHIIGSQFPGYAQPLYTSIKVDELLMLALDKIIRYPTTTMIRMRRDEVQRFHELKEALLSNLEHPLSLKELSRQFGLNIKKLKTGFKALFDKSPFDYLLLVRMEKAKELLTCTDMSIEDIGESVGYSDKHSFSKAFKKYCGQPPASYRREKYRKGEIITALDT